MKKDEMILRKLAKRAQQGDLQAIKLHLEQTNRIEYFEKEAVDRLADAVRLIYETIKSPTI